MEKIVLEMKIVSSSSTGSTGELLSDIHFRLQEYEFFHINIEIQKPNEKYIGNCLNIEEI
jgi:hypothetical protein